MTLKAATKNLIFYAHRSVANIFRAVDSPELMRDMFISNKTLKKLRTWEPKTYLSESSTINQFPSWAFTAHIFYPEYVDVLLHNRHTLRMFGKVLITTSKAEVAQKLRAKFESELHGVNFQIRLCPNKGRNFAPLFVEYAEELKNMEGFVHVHSKRSSHVNPEISLQWSEKFWNLFLCDSELLRRTLSLLSSETRLGLIYPFVSDVIDVRYTWAANYRFAKKFPIINLRPKTSMIAFPAGGMFAVKSDAIEQILNFKWNYDLFPEELGQLDGTPQHYLERLVGLAASYNGFTHAVYQSRIDKFTTENYLDGF